MRAGVLVAVAAMTGCWGSASSTSSVATIVVPPPPAAHDVPAYSMWRGKYQCPQGITGMRLDVSTQPDGTARATFAFYPVEENPRVPSGSFTMTGAMYLTEDGLYELRLEPERWIDQPPDYIMVGLRARSGADLRGMHGRIESSMCNGFEVTRER